MAPTVFEGLRVLDTTRGFAGALVTMVMADNGAEVTRVEPPAGSPLAFDAAAPAPGAVQWHRGKRRVALDLSSPGGAGELRSLLAGADVWVETSRPGALARLGLDPDELAAADPALVHCSITGFGTSGRYAGVAGYEHVVTAAVGRMADFGVMMGLDHPVFTAVPMASFGASQAALQGIAAALHVRGATGRGQHVTTTLVQGLTPYDMGTFLRIQLLSRFPNVTMPGQVDGPPTPAMGYIPARTADGVWVQYANWASHLFWNQATALGLGDLRNDPEYAALPAGGSSAARVRMWELILERTAEQPFEHLMKGALAESSYGIDRYGTTQQGMDHPQVRFNGHVVAVHDPVVGASEQVGPLVRFAATPSVIVGTEGAPTEPAEETPSAAAEAAAAEEPGGIPPVGALAGVVVVECAAMYAAPFGPALLADLGARVVKVEPLEGDLMRANGFLAYKAIMGKESVALDLKQPEAQEILHKLVERADLFMHNYRPGVPTRLGLDYSTLQEVNPDLVYLYAGAYGDDGPYCRMPAYHTIGGAVAGTAEAQAGAGYPPPADVELSMDELKAMSLRLSRANEGNPDASAALVVGTAMVLGLLARDRQGVGQEMLTTMLAASAYAMSADWIRYDGRPGRTELDADLFGVSALYRLYPTSDGWVFVAAPDERSWARLAEALGDRTIGDDPRFADADARADHDAELAAAIGAVLATATADAWQDQFLRHGVAGVRADGPGFAQWLDTEPSARDNGFIADVDDPVLGPHWRHGATVLLSDSPPELGIASAVGAHTRSVLRELGYGDAAIDDLRDRRIVGMPDGG